jgi:ubiquinone/menaquinone biosynthesis C-methylase UbiE
MENNRFRKLKSDYQKRSKHFGNYIKTYKDQELFALMSKPFNSEEIGSYRVLDLGCGTGLSTKHLIGRVKEIYYLDLSPSMLLEGISQKTIDKERVVIHNFFQSNLPFSSQLFDLIIARFTIHDVKKKDNLFKEINRILKKGGFFQLIDMYALNNDSKKFYNKIHGLKTNDSNCYQTYIMTLDEYRYLLENSGLSVFSVKYYRSEVGTNDWLKENQISENRKEFIESLTEQELEKMPKLKQIFGIRTNRNQTFFSFPVVIITSKRR